MNAFRFWKAFFLQNNLQGIKKDVILQSQKRNDVLYFSKQ